MHSFLPVQYAQAAIDAGLFGRVINPIISNIVVPVIEGMFAIGIIVFIYGIIEMVIKSGDAEGREQGKQHMLWGIIGMFIMISAWGIIYLISNTVKTI